MNLNRISKLLLEVKTLQNPPGPLSSTRALFLPRLSSEPTANSAPVCCRASSVLQSVLEFCIGDLLCPPFVLGMRCLSVVCPSGQFQTWLRVLKTGFSGFQLVLKIGHFLQSEKQKSQTAILGQDNSRTIRGQMCRLRDIFRAESGQFLGGGKS